MRTLGNRSGIKKNTVVAINTTRAILANELFGGIITSTSASAVTITLPTAAVIVPIFGAKKQEFFQFVVDNTAGASLVTIAANTGITAISPVAITGSAGLTVTAGSFARFILYFPTETSIIISRNI